MRMKTNVKTPPARAHSRGRTALVEEGPDSIAGDGDGATPLPVTRTRSRRSRRAARRTRRLARSSVIGRHPVRTGIVVVILAATPVWVSLGTALTNPGNGTSLGARLAEWTRLHGGGGIVNWAERTWYTSHAPKVGGAPVKGAIPAVGSSTHNTQRTKSALVGLAVPAPIKPFASPALPGEGVWHPAGRLVKGAPAIYEAFVRPDAVHTSLVAGIAWMDTKLLRATLYSGSTIPGGGPYALTAPVKPSAARALDAAFNSGFLMRDSNGGYYAEGKMVAPLRQGAASFVVYRDGTATIAKWGRDATMTKSVVAVRQNVTLLVDGGQPVPGLNANDTTKWGFTLGNQVYVWRSGIGVTRNGALVYAAGPGLNITTIADLLVRAGAVRAMELDINTDWVDFSTYKPTRLGGSASGANGTNLLAGMAGTPGRYFATWWTRDFFAMSVRS
jgi:hypothetical protein